MLFFLAITSDNCQNYLMEFPYLQTGEQALTPLQKGDEH
jgi:hypothetical protein